MTDGETLSASRDQMLLILVGSLLQVRIRQARQAELTRLPL